jgi:hypothetical protein
MKAKLALLLLLARAAPALAAPKDLTWLRAHISAVVGGPGVSAPPLRMFGARLACASPGPRVGTP